MNVLWPIQTHTYSHSRALEKCAPLLIDQRTIRLEAMHNAQLPRIALLGYTKGMRIKRDGESKRLARMPDDRNRIRKPRLSEKPFKDPLKRAIIDTLCRRSVRKIAIAAAHITKRRRLNDNQSCPCS